MSIPEVCKIINLCALVILKTTAIKEKLYTNQSANNETQNLLIALYCRELLILIRQIEFINKIDDL